MGQPPSPRRRRRSHHAGKTNFKTRRGGRGERGRRGATKEIPAYRWQLPDGVVPPTPRFREVTGEGSSIWSGIVAPWIEGGGDILHMGRPTSLPPSVPSFQPVSFPPNCSPWTNRHQFNRFSSVAAGAVCGGIWSNYVNVSRRHCPQRLDGRRGRGQRTPPEGGRVRMYTTTAGREGRGGGRAWK